MLRVSVTALLLMTAACATTFSGSSNVKGGVQGCMAKCKEAGLEFAGMTFVGEFSDACICIRKDLEGGTRAGLATGAGALAAATAGVIIMQQDKGPSN